jgi:hypothetical protein
LIFWQAPEYERARQVLNKRKQGAQLSKQEAKTLHDAQLGVLEDSATAKALAAE